MFRSLKHAGLLVAIASVLVLGLSSAALAAGWNDLPAGTLDKYGITAAEVSAVSQGFPDGTWRPDQMVTRAQFTKMAIDAFKIARANQAVPSFTDVPADSRYYQYIESAKAAGLITGVTATTFAPNTTMTHEQAFAIVMRWVAKATGVNMGLLGDAPAIAMGNLFQATSQSLSGALHDEVVMAVKYGVYQQGDWGATIDPKGGVTRIQAAAALIRGTKVDGDRLTILGLGAGPGMWTDRNGTGFLLTVNGAEYMVDCGPGTPNAVFQSGVGFGPLKNLFFTHYHFDHYGGYPDLLARAYQTGRPSPLTALDVWGPPGLKGITDGFVAGLDRGFRLHNPDPARPNLPVIPTVHEFDLPPTGVQKVYEDANVVVTATRVYHGADCLDAYAYRFDITSGENAGKSVVFSGDTVKNEQLIALAKDATVLVHEVSEKKLGDSDSDTDAADMPVIAKAANVGMVVLCHYGNIGAQYTLAEAAEMVLTDVLAANATVAYAGRIIAPLELDVIGF